MAYGNSTYPIQPGQDCIDRHGKGRSCATIYSTKCYHKPIRDRCCATCDLYKTDIPDCRFGNRAMQCEDLLEHRSCYKWGNRRDCCKTCKEIEAKYFSGCWYGDNATDCNVDYCPTYSLERRQQCCYTCVSGGTTAITTSSAGITQPSQHTDTPDTSKGSSGPDLVLPIAASIGGFVVLVTILTAVLVYCHWKRRKPPSPITEEMYRDYKIGKRSPMPEPRDMSDKKTTLERQDTGGYAYIRPAEMDFIPTNDTKTQITDKKNNPAPSFDVAGVDKDGYAYLKPQVDKHGYLITTPVDNNTHSYMELQDIQGNVVSKPKF